MKSWKDTYPDKKIIIKFGTIGSSWCDFMKSILEATDIKKIEDKLSAEVDKNKNIFPYPDMLFSAFTYTSFDSVKVVIIGQDPYFKLESGVPQAMGLSFSVPTGIAVPSSLDNIYKNMMKYGHITSIPKHGNLQFLANQGCLFLNTALTVAENEKNGHSDIWKTFTDSIIMKLSDVKDKLVFVLWGAPAFEKFSLIDKKRHKVIVSSHPSGLSCNTPMKTYPAFNNCDHFGQINEYLKANGQMPVIYGL